MKLFRKREPTKNEKVGKEVIRLKKDSRDNPFP